MSFGFNGGDDWMTLKLGILVIVFLIILFGLVSIGVFLCIR